MTRTSLAVGVDSAHTVVERHWRRQDAAAESRVEVLQPRTRRGQGEGRSACHVPQTARAGYPARRRVAHGVCARCRGTAAMLPPLRAPRTAASGCKRLPRLDRDRARRSAAVPPQARREAAHGDGRAAPAGARAQAVCPSCTSSPRSASAPTADVPSFRATAARAKQWAAGTTNPGRVGAGRHRLGPLPRL